jgi:ABC-type transport system involved in multi-copper enzyme maturation permease subunit
MMISSMQMALIRKDIRSITVNRNLFTALWIVPLIFTVFMPTLFILLLYFVPVESSDFQQMLDLLPVGQQLETKVRTIIMLLMNNTFPIFCLIIPIMSASVMAASSFVGEKERRTLETLLYSPLSVTQIFQAKVLACLALSMFISWSSYLVMLVVTQVEIVLTTGSLLLPEATWLVLTLLVSPAVALLAITLIVGGSAKAQTMEESQQRAAFLVIPIAMLVAGQISGLYMLGVWILLVFGLIVLLIALVSMRQSMRKFTYEVLLD